MQQPISSMRKNDLRLLTAKELGHNTVSLRLVNVFTIYSMSCFVSMNKVYNSIGTILFIYLHMDNAVTPEYAA